MIDEANFHLKNMVNQQKFRHRTQEDPRELHAKLLHNPKVTV